MIPALIPVIGVALREFAIKFLAKLGLGIVTFGGFQLLYNELVGVISSNVGALSGPVLQGISLCGGIEAIGIILGAFSVRVSLLSLGKFGVLPK